MPANQTMAAVRRKQRVASLLAPALLIMAASGCGETDPVPELIVQLTEAKNDGRIAAADALRELGPAASAAVPALSDCLQRPHPGVRQAAVRALGEIAAPGDPVQSMLAVALEDPELSVRMAAAWSLHKLDPSGRLYVPVLIDAMRAGEGGTIVAVGKLGPQAEWARPTLSGLLRNRRPGVRRLAAEALARIGPDEDARAALQRATQDPDDRVRAAATAALAAADGSPDA